MVLLMFEIRILQWCGNARILRHQLKKFQDTLLLSLFLPLSMPNTYWRCTKGDNAGSSWKVQPYLQAPRSGGWIAISVKSSLSWHTDDCSKYNIVSNMWSSCDQISHTYQTMWDSHLIIQCRKLNRIIIP